MAKFKVPDAKMLERHAERSNLDEVQIYMRQEVEEWEGTPFHIAVLGSTGEGKSSLINAMLNLADDPKLRAEVGVLETTKTMQSYTSANYENITFWDIPGVGSTEFPRHTYQEKVKFHRYDFYIIVSAVRFTEDDLWLAEEIVNNKEALLFFVRSKVDMDIKNDKRTHPRSHKPEAVLEEIQNCTLKYISDFKVDIPLFLVSNFHPDLYDLKKMTRILMEFLPALQQHAVTMSSDRMASDIIKKKVKALFDRMWKVAARSCTSSKFPFGDTKFQMDVELLARELKFQKEQFGLDEMDVDSLCVVVRDSVQKTYKELVSKQVTTLPSLKQNGLDYWCAFSLLRDHLKFATSFASVTLREWNKDNRC